LPPDPRIFVRNTVVMLVLAILAAATWVATWQRQDANPEAAPSRDARPLGYYANGTRILVTDERGRVTARVGAARLEELPDEELLRLEGVTVDYEPADETAWSISAASANTPKDGSLLELSGNVEVRSVPTDGSEPRTVETQRLEFRPETSNIESDAHVRVRLGDLQFDGVGLSMDLKGDTLRLESEVHGTFFR
jgi:LPS export ABC transporter protein LptC